MENSEESNQYFRGKSTFSIGLTVEFKLFLECQRFGGYHQITDENQKVSLSGKR